MPPPQEPTLLQAWMSKLSRGAAKRSPVRSVMRILDAAGAAATGVACFGSAKAVAGDGCGGCDAGVGDGSVSGSCGLASSAVMLMSVRVGLVKSTDGSGAVAGFESVSSPSRSTAATAFGFSWRDSVSVLGFFGCLVDDVKKFSFICLN
jgi:hypothetical protein